MANADLRRNKDARFYEKKTVSVMAARVSSTLYGARATSDILTLFDVPENSFITGVTLNRNSAGTTGAQLDVQVGGTLNTAKDGFTGGVQAFDDADLGTAGIAASSNTPINANTGATVRVQFGGTAAASYDFTLSVEFVEHTLGNNTLVETPPEPEF